MSNKPLGESELIHLANLAKIRPEDALEGNIAESLNDILGYVASLQEIDTTQVEPVAHIQGISNVFREDTRESGLSIEALKEIAPETEGRSIKVPLFISHTDD